MEKELWDLLSQPNYTPLTRAELMAHLGLHRKTSKTFENLLQQWMRSGRIALVKGNRFVRPLDADLIPGRIRMNRQGQGILQPDDPKLAVIIVPPDATATAMHNDRVLVRRELHPKGLRQQRSEEHYGKVIRVLERARPEIVGTLQQSSNFLYVVPDDPRIPHDIYVPPARDVGLKPNLGDKVVVEIREWVSRHTNPEGEIVEVLGPPDAEGVDMLSILRHFNLPRRFPQKVLQEARAYQRYVSDGEAQFPREDLENRVDCRQLPIITIDPDDAKDFDDAICVQAQPDGQLKLWVHVADVSHYVKPGTALDEEARKRGNSTYLVDRVIPMLPEALSNDLCSLKPHVERLTKCVEFLLTPQGRILKRKFYSAIIRSQHRYTYKEALEILERQPRAPLERMLHQAHRLAQTLRRARMQHGSLELDFPETKIRLDDRGKVSRIEKVENDVSHQLIEEFMLLANEAVAGQLMRWSRPALYRIHESPAERRLQEYREEVLSHHVPCGNLSKREEVQKLLRRLSSLPIGQALKIGFLKSLMRARYAVEPLGHYGLAKAEYTHFTSPIRRYADLVVHRAMFQKPNERITQGSLNEIADQISYTERNSDEAEQASREIKLFAYLTEQLKSGRPERYPALVTGLRNFGFFVDVPSLGLSGLVHLSTLEDDFYFFDAARAQLIGRRSRRAIRLGDKLEVQVAKVEIFKKQVDFRLAPSPKSEKQAKPDREKFPRHRKSTRFGRHRFRGE